MTRLALVVGRAVTSAACNSLSPKLTPVPPVHVVPSDLRGAAVLVAEDAIIESKDPAHHERAEVYNVPHDLRVEMAKAFTLAGFKVVEDPNAPFDLHARIALAVSEPEGKVRQIYRCALSRRDGTPVAQIDWEWPKGTYVGEFEVLEYAAHNLVTEIATSPAVVSELRKPRSSEPRQEDGASSP